MVICGNESDSRACFLISDSITFDILVTDHEGNPICALDSIEIALHGRREKTVENRYDVLYRPLDISVSGISESPVTSSPPVTLLNVPTIFPRSLVDTNYDAISSNSSSLASSSVSSPYTPSIPLSDATEASSIVDSAPSTIYEYIRGEEMKIQSIVADMDSTASESLLFIAEDGLDGAAVLGFTRSLRKEYRLWNIQAAVFDLTWSLDRRMRAAHELVALNLDEPEIKVDASGAIFVPRVELVAAPAAHVAFSPDLPWVLDGEEVKQTGIPHVPADHVAVSVTGVVPVHAGLWEYVGKVDGIDSVVVGIRTGPIATHFNLHKGAVTEASDAFSGDNEVYQGPSLLAAAILAIAAGIQVFSRPERNVGTRVLIHDPDRALGVSIGEVCEDLGMTVSLVTSLSTAELQAHYLERSHLVLSASLDVKEIGVLRSLVATSRDPLFLWNHAKEGLPHITVEKPWVLGDALRASLHFHNSRDSQTISYRPPAQFLPSTSALVALHAPLFNPNKSYVLIGGIGSLGFQVALWMYQVRPLTLLYGNSSSDKNCRTAPGTSFSLPVPAPQLSRDREIGLDNGSTVIFREKMGCLFNWSLRMPRRPNACAIFSAS